MLDHEPGQVRLVEPVDREQQHLPRVPVVVIARGRRVAGVVMTTNPAVQRTAVRTKARDIGLTSV